jgi:type IV pilus assembly protein PilB
LQSLKSIEKRKKLFEEAIRQIQLAMSSTAAYPEDHPISRQVIIKSYKTLTQHLRKQNELTITSLGTKLLVDDVPIDGKDTLTKNFATVLSQRAIDSITFYRGLSVKDFKIFLNTIIERPKVFSQEGGLASILKQYGVTTVKLDLVKYGKLSEDSRQLGKTHILNGDLDKEPETKKEEIHEHHGEVPEQDESRKYKENVIRLLEEGKTGEVKTVIQDLSKKLEDTSWQIRNKVAESFMAITSALDESQKLSENFQEISEVLIKRVEREHHIDTYLAVSENLRNICASQDRADGYLREETIGSRMYEAEKLSKAKLQKALLARKKNGRSLQYNLGALSLVDEATLLHFLAQQYNGCRVVELADQHVIPESILKVIPSKFIKRYLILPFRLEAGNLHMALMKPNDLHILNDIRFISGYSAVPHLAGEYYLINALKRFYHIDSFSGQLNQAIEDLQEENGIELVEESTEENAATEELKDSDAPVVRLVNLILKEAIVQKASDVHIEPYESQLRIRFRIDGTLNTLLTPSVKYSKVVASRIKVMSGLDISERRLPQDGRCKIRISGRHVDCRVSTFPGIFGEKVVLRLLDSSNLILYLNKLGLSHDDLNILLNAIHKSKGMILVTGPTGSGKTTTLYSIIHNLNDGAKNISTAEDPVEYNLKGINQFQMNPKIGLNFARALRTFLRQDPDIIMVGEMRDVETAEIAVKAALTGHLVLSTLHTNSAPETITRLLDMGIQPYLISSSVNLVLAQRLMRKLCLRCKTEISPTDLQLKLLESHDLDVSGHQLFMGEGCEECNNTGYNGRIAIYEAMPMLDKIQELILKGKSARAIKDKTEELGLVSLQDQGLSKVIKGITTLDEWMRVVA